MYKPFASVEISDEDSLEAFFDDPEQLEFDF
jgi:hypothetical protein